MSARDRDTGEWTGKPTMPGQCTATRADGTRCRGRALPGQTRCFIHDESLAQRRAEGAARGGRHKATAHRVRRDLLTADLGPAEVQRLLAGALITTAEGMMHPATLSALAAGARAYVAVREATMVDERLAALEAVLEASATPAEERTR